MWKKRKGNFFLGAVISFYYYTVNRHTLWWRRRTSAGNWPVPSSAGRWKATTTTTTTWRSGCSRVFSVDTSYSVLSSLYRWRRSRALWVCVPCTVLLVPHSTLLSPLLRISFSIIWRLLYKISIDKCPVQSFLGEEWMSQDFRNITTSVKWSNTYESTDKKAHKKGSGPLCDTHTKYRTQVCIHSHMATDDKAFSLVRTANRRAKISKSFFFV